MRRSGVVAAVVAIIALVAFPSTGSAATFSNPTSILVPASGVGRASPYPSPITVDGLTGSVNAVRVTLVGFAHGGPREVFVRIAGPGGVAVDLMGLTCQAPPDATGQTFTFDDAAPAPLPAQGPCPSGTYKPTNYGTAPFPFPAPAPVPAFPSALSAFDGAAANGPWQLFAFDDGAGTDGAFSGGWSLELAAGTCSGVPATVPAHVGTAADDVLTGTAGPDVILGLGGKDRVNGLEGEDVICGGPGKDILRGGGGKDRLRGEGGKDKLAGGGAKDRCIGGKGNDSAKKCEVERSL